ncbi:MAG: hypothetical protein HN350_01580 [Phycisphaerales bacterium]|nr:hypothetical protein [Phycisphaerales bacterium]
MKIKIKTVLAFSSLVLAVMATGISSVSAARKKAAEPTPLTAAGQKLQARYTGMLTALKADLSKSLPAVSEQKKTAYLNARNAEKTAEAAVTTAQKNFGMISKGQALVGHAKGKWIGGADKGIAATTEKLKNATTDAERETLQAELAKWQKNREDGYAALKERQGILDKALRDKPRLVQELDAAKAALSGAQAGTIQAVKNLNIESFLSSNKLDAKLAKYVVLATATPHGLAQFAEKGKGQAKLIEKMLGDNALMIQMAVAGGPQTTRGGTSQYGPAMKIYTDIQAASKKASSGVLQRVALAVSLAHATPIKQRSAVALTEAPATVDPVKRYLSYEKAFLNGELDAGFKGMSVWDYCMVVNGEEPDEISAWGRDMLSNYRPDHISTSDYRWRYVKAVATDVKYGSQDNKYDKPDLQFFQNILMNGGVCGRRAFFGRFILRAFGIPTLARPQRGHAALAHWTPDGWVICLGGGWGAGWVQGRNKDLDFLAVTQARNTGKPYMKVKRAQWVGDVMGETRIFGLLGGDPEFWNGVALYRQRAIIQEAKAVALAAVGTDLGEANESKVKEAIKAVNIAKKDRKIVVGKDGVITIPAAACSKPTNSTRKIIFMPSNLGGMQLHYNRTGGPETFEYTFNAPSAGKYALGALVVTPSWKQHLMVTVNGAAAPIDIELPHTVGMWDKIQPVTVSLVKGKNVLSFSRDHERLKGLTIKEFTLTPVKK